VNNPAGIVAAGVCQLAEVGIEVFFAFRAAVLGIVDQKIDGTVGGKVSEVVQSSYEDLVSIG
jgi:hypothetical protein